VQGRYSHTGADAPLGSAAFVTRGEAERAGTVYPGKKKAQGVLTHVYE